MLARNTWWMIVGLTAVAGCSRQATTPCQPDTRYSTARSAQPVQIPDDLSPPNETDAIRLPSVPGAPALTVAGECLEEPPSFFGDSTPFRRDAATREEEQGRRERRRERREERRAEQSQEASAADGDRAEEASSDGDRTISD